MRALRLTTLSAVLAATTACQPAPASETPPPETPPPATPAPDPATATTQAASARDAAGTYRRTEPANASLVLTRDGEAWSVVIQAGGLPNGAATAADCEVRARGPMQGDTIAAAVLSAGGLDEAEMPADPGQVRITLREDGATVDDGSSVEGPGVAGRFCAMGSDIEGDYARGG